MNFAFDGTGDCDSDATDLEELEIALYGQIHHEQNGDLHESHGSTNLFKVEETTKHNDGDEPFSDCIMFDGKPSQTFVFGHSPYTALAAKDDGVKKPGLDEVSRESDSKKGKKKKTKKKKKKKTVESNKPLNVDDLFIPYIGSDEEEFVVIDSIGGDDDDDITLANVNTNLALNCDELDDVEEMNMTSIHNTMSDKGWQIDDKDRYSDSKMKNRYYTAFNVHCHNCDQKGHLSKCCPLPKKLATCCLCSELGHTNRTCPMAPCHNCGQPGHTFRDCQQRRRRMNEECHRCGMFGHIKNECPEIWRQYHLTISGSGSPTVTGPHAENKRVFCYNCAAEGHFGFDCNKELMDRFRNTQIPFIARYDTSLPMGQHGIKRKHDDYEEQYDMPHKRQKRNGGDERRTYPNKVTTGRNLSSRTNKPRKSSDLNVHAKNFLNSNIPSKSNKNKKKRNKQAEGDFLRDAGPPRNHSYHRREADTGGNAPWSRKGRFNEVYGDRFSGNDFPRGVGPSPNHNWKKTSFSKPQSKKKFTGGREVDDTRWWNNKTKKGGKNRKKQSKKDDVYGHRVSSHRWH